MFDFKIVEQDDDGFTVSLTVDGFVYTVLWSSWAVFACSGAPEERVPIDLVYFDPI